MDSKNRKGLTREMVEQKVSGLSYADIAKPLGISRQRVQQLFSPRLALMEQVADRAKALCEQCGQFDQFGHYHHKVYDFDILNTLENILYLCSICHLQVNGEPHFCKNCGKRIPPGRRYCSPECRQAYYSLSANCSFCHKVFVLGAQVKARVRRSETGLLFCSKVCQGKYAAEHWGFQPGHK